MPKAITLKRVINAARNRLQISPQRIGTNIRILREKKTITLHPDDVEKLSFYQFKKGTAAYFLERYGRTDIRVVDTPHFQFAAALHSKNSSQIEEATQEYIRYLKSSWNADRHHLIPERVTAFKEHFRRFEADPASRSGAVISYFASNEPGYVIDGNHRTSFSAATGKPLKVDIWPLDLAFLKFANTPEFYGTGNRNKPYQSVYHKGQIVIEGRRKDMIERLSMVPDDILRDKTILDVASNVGMSSIEAVRRGAKSSLGLEISPGMTDLSTRFAMFEGLYPTVRFETFNVDHENLDEDLKFDTAFMFSIYSHLKRPERLKQIVERHVTGHVVFEGHPRDPMEKYASFFNSGLFTSVTEIGRLSESEKVTTKSRILWLCVRK